MLPKLEAIRDQYNGRHRDRPVSLADLIVLGGSVAVEKAAADAGTPVKIPFMAGRTDASQEQTDVKSFNYLEPKADGFRNYYLPGQRLTAPEAMVDKASTLGLTTSEMTVLIGGMRALNANAGGSSAGVLTTRPGLLTNDFFVNLLDMNTAWAPMDATNTRFVGKDRNGGQIRW
ncbi:catalase-peroxidase, partial [Escherichia coli]|nr:catalase-peroxidase [Escherichia coli]